MSGGITYAAAKGSLCRVVDNGVAPTDQRVMDRTNEATKVVLDALVPVNGMMTIEMNAVGQLITLPKELDNIIDLEVLQGNTVRGSMDNTRAFYDVINQFAYVDSGMAHDNPLVDQGLNAAVPFQFSDGIITLGDLHVFQSATANFTQEDVGSLMISDNIIPGTKIASFQSATQVTLDTVQAGAAPGITFIIQDRTTLVRSYLYPGLQANARVRITGAKAFVPITEDSDFLIVQNLEALKLVILSIERYENNDPTNAKLYRDQGIELLQAEVKKFILDPRNILARKAAYEDDITNYAPDSLGNTRGRIAVEVPGAMLFGKNELTRILNEAERRLMSKGMWRNSMREFHALVTPGPLYFPRDVDSILAAEQCGMPLDIRSIFFSYLENGPGHWGSCYNYLEDKGDEYFPTSKNTRRKYHLHGGPIFASGNASVPQQQRLTFIAKIKWVKKEPNDQMVIKNFEALRLMVTAIVSERKEDWQNAGLNGQMAIKELQDDLNNYLRGIKHTLPIETHGFGMGDVGGLL